LECEFRCYEMFEGKRNAYKKALAEGNVEPVQRKIATRPDRSGDTPENEDKPDRHKALEKRRSRMIPLEKPNRSFSNKEKSFRQDGKSPFDKKGSTSFRKVKKNVPSGTRYR